jgi:hypothetical protein
MSNVFASSRFGGGGGGFGSSPAGGAVVQDVATQLVNTVKQVGVIDSVPTTIGEVPVLLVQVITSGNNLSSNQSTWER